MHFFVFLLCRFARLCVFDGLCALYAGGIDRVVSKTIHLVCPLGFFAEEGY